MENQTEQTYLAQEKLGRLMRKYAVPCMVSLLVAALYNIVDQIFIANCQLSGILRKRRQYGGIPADGDRIGRCCYDRGWLLCFCQPQPWEEETGGGPSQHWQRRCVVCSKRDSAVRGLPDFFCPDFVFFRRHRK